MNQQNINMSLGAWFFLTLVAALSYWGEYLGENPKVILGMSVAAGLALFFFTVNTQNNKWLWGVVVGLFIIYLFPFPYYAFTTNLRTLSQEMGEILNQRQKFFAEALREDKVVAQELTRCNTIMLADQKPFLEGPTGLKEVARYKATGKWSQDLYEQWHAHNIAKIREVHERRKKCGERAALLSPSAKIVVPASDSGIHWIIWVEFILVCGLMLAGIQRWTRTVYMIIAVMLIVPLGWIVFGDSGQLSGWAKNLDFKWLPKPIAAWIKGHATIIMAVVLGYIAIVVLWQTKAGEFVVKPLLGIVVVATVVLFTYWFILGGGWRVGLSLLPKM